MVLAATVVTLAATPDAPRSGFVLGGEPVTFGADLRPRFTKRQIASTAEETRAGFDRWARTREGRWIIRRLRESDRSVVVLEDPEQESIGRAPQPGFTILLAAANRAVHKEYAIVLNPRIAAQYQGGESLDLGRPRTPADAMALAWAAEMLHIDFYADGITLPHHERADFQERWSAVAGQLGFPNTPHGKDD
ncbi:MAG TPA: hypothetical protein VGE86_04235 [Thermoanaerobaculia bacterium]